MSAEIPFHDFLWFLLPHFFCSIFAKCIWRKTKRSVLGCILLSVSMHCLITVKLTLRNRYGQQPTRLNMHRFLTFVICLVGSVLCTHKTSVLLCRRSASQIEMIIESGSVSKHDPIGTTKKLLGWLSAKAWKLKFAMASSFRNKHKSFFVHAYFLACLSSRRR